MRRFSNRRCLEDKYVENDEQMENGGPSTPSITLKKQSAQGRFLNSLDFLQVVVGVLVGHVGGADVQLEVRPKILKVVVVWKF